MKQYILLNYQMSNVSEGVIPIRSVFVNHYGLLKSVKNTRIINISISGLSFDHGRDSGALLTVLYSGVFNVLTYTAISYKQLNWFILKMYRSRGTEIINRMTSRNVFFLICTFQNIYSL